MFVKEPHLGTIRVTAIAFSHLEMLVERKLSVLQSLPFLLAAVRVLTPFGRAHISTIRLEGQRLDLIPSTAPPPSVGGAMQAQEDGPWVGRVR